MIQFSSCVPLVFQLCCNCVPVVFHLCSSFPVVFQSFSSCVPVVFHSCSSCVPVFHLCSSCVPLVFQLCSTCEPLVCHVICQQNIVAHEFSHLVSKAKTVHHVPCHVSCHWQLPRRLDWNTAPLEVEHTQRKWNTPSFLSLAFHDLTKLFS